MSAATNRTRQRDYAIGYGRPPKHTRFRKGQSGNPRGRPRGDTRAIPPVGLSQVLRKAAGRPVSMTVDGRRTRTTLAEAIIQQLLGKAAKGDHRSTKLFCDLLRLTETASDARSHEEWLDLLNTEDVPAPTDCDRAKAIAALLARAKGSEPEE